jgi:hypothetical protein
MYHWNVIYLRKNSYYRLDAIYGTWDFFHIEQNSLCWGEESNRKVWQFHIIQCLVLFICSQRRWFLTHIWDYSDLFKRASQFSPAPCSIKARMTECTFFFFFFVNRWYRNPSVGCLHWGAPVGKIVPTPQNCYLSVPGVRKQTIVVRLIGQTRENIWHIFISGGSHPGLSQCSAQSWCQCEYSFQIFQSIVER